MNDNDHLVNALECLLFAAKEPVPMQRLADVLAVDVTLLPGLLQELGARREGTGLDVVQLAGGYSLATRPDYADYVRTLLEPDPERLSVQALETLAIVAYRQPMTRPEIDEVRGVNSSGAVASLIQKDLVRVAGRKDAPGRPFLLETTPHFLSLFGLKDLDDLPDIGELRRAMEQQGLAIDDDPTPDDFSAETQEAASRGEGSAPAEAKPDRTVEETQEITYGSG